MEETKIGTVFIRTKKERNYTVMDNTFLRDERLSAKAKGIFAYILYLPEDWCIYQSELVKHFSDGKDALRAAIKELETLGYISKEHIKDIKTGRFTHWQYTVNETPKTPEADFPKLDFPKLDNPPLLNTDNKINTNNNKISEVDTSDFPEDPNEIKPKKTTRSKKLSKTELNEQYISSLTEEERTLAEKCADLMIEYLRPITTTHDPAVNKTSWQADIVRRAKAEGVSLHTVLKCIQFIHGDSFERPLNSSPEKLFKRLDCVYGKAVEKERLATRSKSKNYNQRGSFASELYGEQKWDID